MQINTIQITNLSHEGRGVGRNPEGKTVFVDGVLPGELVSYKVTRKRRNFDEAELVEVLQAAADRVVPGCKFYAQCGGCAQQHVAASAQIANKLGTVLELFTHAGVVPEQVMPALVGPIWGYRTKARLGVRYVIKKGEVLVGFREKHSNYLAEITECVVLHPVIGTLIKPLREFIAGLDGYKVVAQLEVAVGSDRLAIIVRHLEPLSARDFACWCEFAREHSFDLYLQSGGMETVTKVWPVGQRERLYYELPEYGLRFAFHPTDFTQVNEHINRQMVHQALAWLEVGAQDVVLDLFCGLGNFSLPLAKLAARVVGVEGSEAMVARGYENAALNGVDNVAFYAADLFKEQDTAVWAQQRYDKILLDPPRAGALEVLPLVHRLGASMILYVSCNPITLVRDSVVLVQEYGYRLVKVAVMDMFPHTTHVETMGLFVR